MSSSSVPLSSLCCLGSSLPSLVLYGLQSSLLSFSLSSSVSDFSSSSFHFWGKINGVANDYYIIRELSVSKSISKKYYFSADQCVSFHLLPSSVGDSFVYSRYSKIRGPFTGNPAHRYREKKKNQENSANESEEEEEEEDEEEDDAESLDEESAAAKLASSRLLTELERLSATVQSIDHDCFLVPTNAFKMNCFGVVEMNTAFPGVPLSAFKDRTHYQFFRTPECPSTLAAIRSAGIASNAHCLDTLQDGAREGEWCLVADPSGLSVSVRSLLWPGYEFSYDATTKTYQSAYFGEGVKNEDILFMMQ